MEMTIGIWVIPAFVTMAAVWWAFASQEHVGHWADAGTAILNLVRLCVGAIVSLIAWFVWALMA